MRDSNSSDSVELLVAQLQVPSVLYLVKGCLRIDIELNCIGNIREQATRDRGFIIKCRDKERDLTYLNVFAEVLEATTHKASLSMGTRSEGDTFDKLTCL